MARGVAGGEDEPLVAIEFAEEGMRHEIEAQLLGIGRSGGEFDGVLAGGVEFVSREDLASGQREVGSRRSGAVSGWITRPKFDSSCSSVTADFFSGVGGF